LAVNRDEAEKLCRQQAEERADRDTHTWIARENEAGDWRVVKIPLPPYASAERLVAAVEGKPVPPADLRPLIHQNIPPGGADGEAGDGD
jgi:hypothetical protein